MIPGYEYCHPGLERQVWCIRRESARLTLCGSRVGSVPVVQPEHPRTVHGDCLRVMYVSGPKERPQRKPEPVREMGCCPKCGTRVVLDRGRVSPHRESRVSVIGARYDTDKACVGERMLPAVGGGR